jgi:chemotaxis protein methyltransferase CheR
VGAAPVILQAFGPRRKRKAMFEKQFADLQNACLFADAIVATVREPLLVLDENLRVIAASRAFYARFRVEP